MSERLMRVKGVEMPEYVSGNITRQPPLQDLVSVVSPGFFTDPEQSLGVFVRSLIVVADWKKTSPTSDAAFRKLKPYVSSWATVLSEREKAMNYLARYPFMLSDQNNHQTPSYFRYLEDYWVKAKYYELNGEPRAHHISRLISFAAFQWHQQGKRFAGLEEEAPGLSTGETVQGAIAKTGRSSLNKFYALVARSQGLE